MTAPRLALLLCLSVLCACDGGGPKEAAGPAPRIFDTQRDALDKAKALQESVKQAAEQQRQEREAQTE
jgi:hypothetical protein